MPGWRGNELCTTFDRSTSLQTTRAIQCFYPEDVGQQARQQSDWSQLLAAHSADATLSALASRSVSESIVKSKHSFRSTG